MFRPSLIPTVLLTAVAVVGLAVAQELPRTPRSAPPATEHEHDHDAKPAVPEEAVAVMMPTEGSRVTGTIRLVQQKGHVHITGEVQGLTPGQHGFHVHEFGDLRDRTGKSAGDHFNPTGDPHGGPESEHKHAGDLGNIVANDDGVAIIDMKAEGLKLHFVVGRSLVVHAKADDLTTQPSGDSGDRVAVGVIGFAQLKNAPENPTLRTAPPTLPAPATQPGPAPR